MYPNKNPSQDMLEREQSCAEESRHVSWADLPLECPMPDTSLWNGHPRIYLPIHETGEYRCTYCGTLYILDPPEPGEPAPQFANMEIDKQYRKALQKVQAGNAATPESTA